MQWCHTLSKGEGSLRNLSVLKNKALLKNVFWISFVWLLGLVVGWKLHFNVMTSWDWHPYSLSYISADLFNIVITLIAPFLLVALFLYLRTRLVLYIFLFVKAMVTGAVYCILGAIFTGAGWLITLLILLPSSVNAAAMLFYTLAHTLPERNRHSRFFICLTVIILVCIIDYYKISPFLMTLFSY